MVNPTTSDLTFPGPLWERGIEVVSFKARSLCHCIDKYLL
jgi:hypothetical protein